MNDESVAEGTYNNAWSAPNLFDTYSFWGGGSTKISMYSDNSNMNFYLSSSILNTTYGQQSIDYYGGIYSYTSRLSLTTYSGPYSIRTTGLGRYVMRLEKCVSNSAMPYENNDNAVLRETFIASQPNIAFNVYPNPANNEVVVQLDKPQAQPIEIIDIAGSVLLNVTAQDHFTVINTEILPEGMYFIKTTIEGATVTKKLIVSR